MTMHRPKSMSIIIGKSTSATALGGLLALSALTTSARCVSALAAASSSSVGTTSTAATFATHSNGGGGWSDAARASAARLSMSQRERLEAAGVLNMERPVTIRARRVDTTTASNPPSPDSTVSKTIHFQRHGQGYHNLLGDLWREQGNTVDLNQPDPQKNPFVRPEVLDAPLTELGRQESAARRIEAAALTPQLIVVSPLHRAMQTAQITFAQHRNDAKDTNSAAARNIPWLAHEGCREELGLLTCNQRRPLSETMREFPDIDFSLVMSGEEDSLFLPDRRETELEKCERAYEFMVNFVRQRPEEELAVVGHSAWLFSLANAVMDCEEESLSSWWLTSEVRSMHVSFEET